MKKFRKLSRKLEQRHTGHFQEFAYAFKDIVRDRYGINYTPEKDNFIKAQKLVHGNYFIRGMNFVISMFKEREDSALLEFAVEVADTQIWAMELTVDEPWQVEPVLEELEIEWERDLENIVL